MKWFDDLDTQLSETSTMMDGAISTMGKLFEPKKGVDASEYEGQAADLMINLCKTLKYLNETRSSLKDYAKKFKEIEAAKKQTTIGEKKKGEVKQAEEKKPEASPEK